jgi:hypothetical protein
MRRGQLGPFAGPEALVFFGAWPTTALGLC